MVDALSLMVPKIRYWKLFPEASYMSQEVKPRSSFFPRKPSNTEVMPAGDIELMSDNTAALFQSTPKLGSMIMVGVVALIIIALIWATFSELEEVTVGEGKVIPSSQVQLIQNLEGGIISSIPVKVGDI